MECRRSISQGHSPWTATSYPNHNSPELGYGRKLTGMAKPVFASLLHHWPGLKPNTRPSRRVLVGGQTTNMISTAQYNEIILIEDEDSSDSASGSRRSH